MKINAYILAGDPAWIESSVLSYYDLVDRIVVSYDADSRGWTGTPIHVEQCLRRLRAIDRAGKFDYRPGNFARAEFFDRPMESETHQRQVAQTQASDGADWILQLDTDEIIADLPCIQLAIECASKDGAFTSMTFPFRWVYQHISGRWFLEGCKRGWRPMYDFPGPIAVRSGGRNEFARRVKGPVYHVHTSNRYPKEVWPHIARPHFVVGHLSAGFHMSWVRSEAAMRLKLASWGHARERDFSDIFAEWQLAKTTPLRTSLTSQFRRWHDRNYSLRLMKLPTSISLYPDNVGIRCEQQATGCSDTLEAAH